MNLDAGDGCTVNSVTFQGMMTVAVSRAPASGQLTSTVTFEDVSVDDQHIDDTLDS